MVSVAIVIAGSTGVRSLLQTTVRADSADTEKIAACSHALPVATVSRRAASTEDTSAPTGLNRDGAASSATDAGRAIGDDTDRDFSHADTPVSPSSVRDPFQPLFGMPMAAQAAAPPVATTPAVPAPVHRLPVVPVLTSAQPASTEPADPPFQADQDSPKPPVESSPRAPDPPQPQPSVAPAQPAPPATAITLIGTVGDDRSAVAVFRVGEKTLFLRPMDAVAGSRIKRIETGQVWLSCHNVRQLVRVGDEFRG
jgi:hypothetical protein